MELASCHHSGTYNLEVAAGSVENKAIILSGNCWLLHLVDLFIIIIVAYLTFCPLVWLSGGKNCQFLFSSLLSYRVQEYQK
jgi:hypothetical protein